jgi:hypothetical protein
VAHLAFKLSALTLRFLDLDQSHSSQQEHLLARKIAKLKTARLIDRVGVDARSTIPTPHSTCPSRPLPPRRPVSFLHPGAPRASHPLTRKSPIKSHRPEPCSSKQGLPLNFFDTGRGVEQRAKVSRHVVSIQIRRCASFGFRLLVTLAQPQLLSGSGGGKVSRFCSVDVALNAALVQGIMQRSTGAPHKPQDPLLRV